MNTLIIYDSTGYILDIKSGGVREPIGVPFLWVEIPDGKRIKITDDVMSLIDISVTPNVAILEDIPKTEMELIQEDNEIMKSSLSNMSETMMALMMAGMPPM
ncbi:hypothetical protein [Clostridium sp.]|uniref:hypothetical protein n=1 Tax=Clostridium sp. TaxID=1506 RepID=UPI001A62E7F3|nr:hypothetical protein [Clostridium sp.]MBK5243407.1 hypothetical protein [Clostridium sp.]